MLRSVTPPPPPTTHTLTHIHGIGVHTDIKIEIVVVVNLKFKSWALDRSKHSSSYKHGSDSGNQTGLRSAVACSWPHTLFRLKHFPLLCQSIFHCCIKVWGEELTFLHQPVKLGTINLTYTSCRRPMYYFIYIYILFYFKFFALLFTVMEYFEGKCWPSSFFAGLSHYRWFMASDWLKQPVAQACHDWLINPFSFTANSFLFLISAIFSHDQPWEKDKPTKTAAFENFLSCENM